MQDLSKKNRRMVQYSVWPNCNNNCSFCLRKERDSYSLDEQLMQLDAIQQNIQTIDWTTDFPYGISLLGGELYSIKNKQLQKKFLELVDSIIENILMRNTSVDCKFSSVTNGIYDNTFLCSVIDKIVDKVGIMRLDLNFSYDLKYRFKTEQDRLLALHNINFIHQKYDYACGVQMILTQYLIEYINSGKFDIQKFLNEDVRGSILSFLYPHTIATGCTLDDFYFRRKDLLDFVVRLKDINYGTYLNFLHSTKNSGTFKYTGLKTRIFHKVNDFQQKPILSDGKEQINPKCGHSLLYKCYADSDKCLLCDLKMIDNSI